jgi:hypothetical protein
MLNERKAFTNLSLFGPQERRGLRPSASPSLIDISTSPASYGTSRRRRERDCWLRVEAGFWATARSLAEVLPDGKRADDAPRVE